MELQFSKIAKFAHPYYEFCYFVKLLLNYNFPSRSNLHTLTVNLEVFRAGRVNGYNNGLAGPARPGRAGLGRAGPGRARGHLGNDARASPDSRDSGGYGSSKGAAIS